MPLLVRKKRLLWNRKIDGTTDGGNPLVCAAASKVLDIFQEDNILDHVREIGKYLYERLEEVKDKNDKVIAHRGLGLMQGLEVSCPPSAVINKALNRGLILISAGTNVIRFVPPLIITKEHVDEMIEILNACLNEE